VNYCPIINCTFSSTLDFASGGGIADDSVVPDNSSIAVMTRNVLFMSAQPQCTTNCTQTSNQLQLQKIQQFQQQ